MSASSVDGKLTENTHKTAARTRNDHLLPSITANLLKAHTRQDPPARTKQHRDANPEAFRFARNGGAPPAVGSRVQTEYRPITSSGGGERNFAGPRRAIVGLPSVVGRPATATGNEQSGLYGSSNTNVFAKRKPVPQLDSINGNKQAPKDPMRGLERPHRGEDQDAGIRRAPAANLHRVAPTEILASPQHAPAGKEQLLMRLNKQHSQAPARHKDRGQPAVHASTRRDESTSTDKRRKNEKASVFSLSDSQLASRYTFVKEIGYGEWGSIWTAVPVKNLDHLPSSAYPQIRSGKLIDPDQPAIENPHHRPLAMKVCTRERNSKSSQRTERLWHEFRALRSLIDASDSSSNGSGSNSRSSSSPRRGASKADRIFGSDWHTSIVKFYEFVITPSITMIVMPCYDEPMKVGLPEERCRAYFQQLLSGMFWLHQRSICHNDIKVANIMVNYDQGLLGKGTPILVDFGFATVHDPGKKDAFHTRVSWGTPEYLAPERARGDLHDERGSDVWSLGVTFFEMAVTRTPFEQQDEQFVTRDQMQAYYHRTMSGVWVGSWDIPAELEDLVRRMLTPTPVDRIDAADALLHPYFDPANNSYDNSLEDILDMFPSDEERDDDGGSSVDDDEGDGSAEHDPGAKPGLEAGIAPERLLNPSNSEPLLSGHLEDDLQRRATWTGNKNRVHIPTPAACSDAPASPTLSAMGMDSFVSDLAHATPPWGPNSGKGKGRHAAILERSTTKRANTNSAVPSHNAERAGRGVDDSMVVVHDASPLQTPSKPRPASRGREVTLPSPSPLTLPNAIGTVRAKTARTPLKDALRNAAIKTGLLNLEPAAVGRTPSPLKPVRGKASTDVHETPSRPSTKMATGAARRGEPLTLSPGDVFLEAPITSAKGMARPQAPQGLHSVQRAENVFTMARSGATTSATGTPKLGTRMVACLAQKFDGPAWQQQPPPPPPQQQPIARDATDCHLAGQQEVTRFKRGHGRSQSCSKAVQTDKKLSRRASIAVQANTVDLGTLRSGEAGSKLALAELASGECSRHAMDGSLDETVAGPRTPISLGTTDSSITVQSFSSSEASPMSHSDHLRGDPANFRQRRDISNSFGISSGSSSPEPEVRASERRPVPSSEPKRQTLAPSGRLHHRRTKTGVDGDGFGGRLEHMEAIAETLTQLISDTRSSLLGAPVTPAASARKPAHHRPTTSPSAPDQLPPPFRRRAVDRTRSDANANECQSGSAPRLVARQFSLDFGSAGRKGVADPSGDDASRGKVASTSKNDAQWPVVAAAPMRVRSESEVTVTPDRKALARLPVLPISEQNAFRSCLGADRAGTESAAMDDNAASSPAPRPPSKDRVEAIYSSYLLRSSSVQKQGDGFVGVPTTPTRSAGQAKPHASKPFLAVHPSEDALDELLVPMRHLRAAAESDHRQKQSLQQASVVTPGNRPTLPQQNTNPASAGHEEKPPSWSGKRFGFASLRRPRSLASLFSPRSPLMGQKQLEEPIEVTIREPARDDGSSAAEVVVPALNSRRATKMLPGTFQIISSAADPLPCVSLELEAIQESEAADEVQRNASDRAKAPYARKASEHIGSTHPNSSTVHTAGPPSQSVSPPAVDRLTFPSSSMQPPSRRRSSSFRRLSREYGTRRHGVPAVPVTAARKAQRGSAAQPARAGGIGSLWRLFRGAGGAASSGERAGRRSEKERAAADLSVATVA